MANYLAVDSGGTKVLAILYNETFQPIKICRAGSCRANTASANQVEHNLSILKRELGLSSHLVLDQVTGIMDTSFLNLLTQSCEVRKIVRLSELEAGLCAAELFDGGILALSGTGSNISAQYQDECYCAGGYGAAVSDAGSGYWIGRHIMEAAIADFEGYGDYTLLTELVARHFGRDRNHFREAVFSLYSHPEISAAAHVASCAPLATEAAIQGDRIALSILSSAGKSMGDQVTALVRNYKLPNDLPLTISGSAWKNHRIFFDTFAGCVYQQNAARPIRIPDFEPIIGVMIHHYQEVHGTFDHNMRTRLKEYYPQYIFQLPFSADGTS